MYVMCRNLSSQQEVLLKDCRGLIGRTVGFMGQKCPENRRGILVKGNGIHTFFMRFPLCCVFLDATGKIVKVYDKIAPWRMTRFVKGARFVIETPYSLEGWSPEEGQMMELSDV